MMLGSWFNRKELTENSDKFPTTLREPSPIQAFEEPRKYPPHSLAGQLSTPHDALFVDPAGTYTDGHSQKQPPIFDLSPTSAVLIAPGLDTLVDPFDGSVLGKMTLPDPNLTNENIPMGEEINQNEELWSHLSRVLELQSDIAKLHMGMEGIMGEYGKGKNKGKVTPNLGKNKDAMESRHKVTRISSVLDDPDHVGEDEGVEVGPKDDEEERRSREREEEFARLADQFEGRKEGINEIMLKLDDLSQALTEFHALQEPKVNFPPSRHSSVPIGSAPSSPTSMDHTRTTFTPIPPLTPIIPITPPSKTERIVSPSRLVDSPVSTTESTFAKR
ncbi:hypothetical protein E1B28_001448 [Marasmius oreades]|uniref:Uncharacterized protein n=1 Tax=Marasmius oreades TaxID=181124 RepID=A0A9P7V3G4_9AGAR|nr:uncharacterized protein E1B28_001448 [Marasmius oreades]KAG7099620.1 hypothetical protein E1B28_001448 [Marasmius oreades]